MGYFVFFLDQSIIFVRHLVGYEANTTNAAFVDRELASRVLCTLQITLAMEQYEGRNIVHRD